MKAKFLTIALMLFSFGANAGMVVIGNAANSAPITESDVKKLFLGKKTKLANGGSVQLIELGDGSEERINFHKLSTGRSEKQLQSVWSRLVFTGKASAPITVGSYSEVINEVSNNTNAIGYVDEASLTDDVVVLYRF